RPEHIDNTKSNGGVGTANFEANVRPPRSPQGLENQRESASIRKAVELLHRVDVLGYAYCLMLVVKDHDGGEPDVIEDRWKTPWSAASPPEHGMRLLGSAPCVSVSLLNP